MDVVTLEQAKEHLRVTNSAEDNLIRLYIKAATSYIIKFLNRDDLPGEDESPLYIPDDIKAAGLLIIGGMYEVREDKIVGQLNAVVENPAAMALLHPHRVSLGI